MGQAKQESDGMTQTQNMVRKNQVRFAKFQTFSQMQFKMMEFPLWFLPYVTVKWLHV